MKLKNIEIVSIINLLDKYTNLKLPQKISYAITRNMHIISKEYRIYESQLQKLLERYKEYTVKKDDGEIETTANGFPVIVDEKSNEFNKELKDLLEIEIDINCYHIDSSVFDYEDSNGLYDILTPKDIFSLEAILCDSENS